MRRFLKYGSVAIVIAILGYAAWWGARTVYFYVGPSEKLLSQTMFDRQAAAMGLLGNTYRFAPMYPFWSDGARKERYLFLPANTKIDTSDPDAWNFPEGTRLWKTFERDGTHVETRMLYKTGPEPWDWDMAVYAPRDDRGESVKLALGKRNVAGTDHDIPAPSTCVTCHSSGEKRKPLGITAIQLPWDADGGLSLSALKGLDLLTDPPTTRYAIPGDPVAQTALGYFDTNCGSCHYEGSTYVTDKVPLRMNLTTDTLSSVEATNVYRTAIGQEPHLDGMGTEIYVHPGDPSRSFVFRRMAVRDKGIWQMPPLATEVPDEDGLARIREWIVSLGP